MTTEQITLYTAKICPFAHRTELALAEAKAEFTRYEIDLSNKPEWYPKVNPASKVPAIAYGGPAVSPDSPSPESEKIAESLVLVEFIADLYPDAKLMPKDPGVSQEKLNHLSGESKFHPAFTNGILGYGASNIPHKSLEPLLQAFEAVQGLLPAEGGWAIGEEFSLADVAVAPFLGRACVLLENDLGAYEAGVGKKTYETLTTEPKYARVMKYFDDLKARESFQKTFDKDVITGSFKKKHY